MTAPITVKLGKDFESAESRARIFIRKSALWQRAAEGASVMEAVDDVTAQGYRAYTGRRTTIRAYRWAVRSGVIRNGVRVK